MDNFSEAVKSFDIFTMSAMLLAFMLTFYGLTARERKTPYIISSVYATSILILITIFIALCSNILKKYNVSINEVQLHLIIEWIADVFLLVSFLYVIIRIIKIHNHHIHFRDDKVFRNMKLTRFSKTTWRSLRPKKPYEHKPIPLKENILSELNNIDELKSVKLPEICESNNNNAFSTSMAISTSGGITLNNLLLEMVYIFLINDSWVQYMSCYRHPLEFVLRLKRFVKDSKKKQEDWEKLKHKLIIVDAHTPNFGFTDSTYDERKKQLIGEESIEYVKSTASYAGMHSASARAFNTIKKKSKSSESAPHRTATLVVYDGPFSVSDIESIEQYKLFIRHVIPSEKLWGGMFTLFVEYSIEDQFKSLLKTYVDIYIDTSDENKDRPK